MRVESSQTTIRVWGTVVVGDGVVISNTAEGAAGWAQETSSAARHVDQKGKVLSERDLIGIGQRMCVA